MKYIIFGYLILKIELSFITNVLDWALDIYEPNIFNWDYYCTSYGMDKKGLEKIR